MTVESSFCDETLIVIIACCTTAAEMTSPEPKGVEQDDGARSLSTLQIRL